MNNTRRNILVVTGIYPPDIGGPATHLAQNIPHFVEQGCNVVVATFGSRAESSVDKRGDYEVRVVRVARDGHPLVRLLRFFNLVRREAKHAHIMYLHDMSLAGLATYVASLWTKTPYVLRLGGDFVWEQAFEKGATTEGYLTFQGNEPFPYLLRRALGTRIARRAKKIIVPSAFLKDVVCRWGVGSERVEVVPNAVDESALLHGGDGLGAELTAKIATLKKNGTKIVVSSGRFVKWKHFDVLAEAAQSVGSVHVFIVGAGPEETRVREIASRGEHVTVLPPMGRSSLAALFREADCFVLLSRGETFSFVVLEALLSGLPVVLAREAALADIFGPYEGEGVSFVDAIEVVAVAKALEGLGAPGGLKKPTPATLEGLRATHALDAHLSAIWGIMGPIN